MPTPTTEGAKVVAPSEYQALMQAAFAHIHPPGDWKGPINCLVPWEAASLYVKAIEFMTATHAYGSEVTHPEHGRMYHLTAAGYRAGPAGP